MSAQTSPGTILRCPACRAALELTSTASGLSCEACGRRIGDADGVLDFVTDPARASERAYYEAEYGATEGDGRVALEALATPWTHPAKPVNRALRQALGDLRGRRVLLVGNGGSGKELHFLLDEPELLIVSDLAAAGVRSLRERHDVSRYEDRLTFAAIDALDLPLADASVDVVYGNAIVHHLPDRARFLAEVARVLRPGGYAVFADSAYASVWQTAKLTLLKPLMAYSHRRYPRSPEDICETQLGGFREAELMREIRALGCEPHARRLSLLFYIWRRATLVALPPRLRHLGDNVAIARALTAIDRLLARVPFLRAQQVQLVWGLRKP